MIDDLEPRWRDLIRQGEPADREVDASSPIRMIFGVDAALQPNFLVVVDHKPGMPQLSGAVSVFRRRRADGRWVLNLVLTDLSLTDIFITLVVDLAFKCRQAGSQAQALTYFLAGVEMWQRLLRAQFNRLSEEAVRGLMAELHFGFIQRGHGIGLAEAVLAWGGPFGAPQDFDFSAEIGSYEVKAVWPQKTVVKVSSAEQLDHPNLRLVIVAMDRGSQTSPTLPSIVERVRESFTAPELSVEFRRRFAELMVDLNDPYYADLRFDFLATTQYRVSPDFPAIRRSSLPPPVGRVRYSLDLQSLEEFKVIDGPRQRKQDV